MTTVIYYLVYRYATVNGAKKNGSNDVLAKGTGPAIGTGFRSSAIS